MGCLIEHTLWDHLSTRIQNDCTTLSFQGTVVSFQGTVVPYRWTLFCVLCVDMSRALIRTLYTRDKETAATYSKIRTINGYP
jgi:hypothetical protein